MELLEHNSKGVATQIYDVFQLSYKVEAGLVGVDNFPPLRRSASFIQSSSSQFFGQRIGSDLAAVIEFTSEGENLSIDSLVVHPQYFRRGLASQLLQSLLEKRSWQHAFVETAAANDPALELYQKFGFAESKRWETSDGIKKVRLMSKNSG